jgi:hypothetical protein
MPFHHELVPAKALVDIWRGLIHEQCKAMVLLRSLSLDGQATANKIVKKLATDIMELAKTRNDMLHATWRIGWWLPDQDDLSSVNVEKYFIGKRGLEKRVGLPQSFTDLMKLGDDAQKIAGRMGRFMQFFIYDPQQIENVFQLKGDEWIFVPPNQPSTPAASPKKAPP